MNRKIAPETPSATIKPFQKSDKKSLFILLGMILNIIIYFLTVWSNAMLLIYYLIPLVRHFAQF